jgi:TRAP-type C4-dicarboxylate transport system permease small subunit
MNSFSLFTRRVNALFLAIAGAMVVAILLALGYDLVARNIFDSPTLWALDASRFLLMFVFFLGLAPALEHGSHVSVDIVEGYLTPGPRRILAAVAHLLLLIFGAFLMWQVWRYTAEAFADNSFFPTVVPIKLKHVYWIGPLGVLQFLLTGLAMLGTTLSKRTDALANS